MRTYRKLSLVQSGIAIPNGNTTPVGALLPLGNAYYALLFDFKFVVTETTAATALTDALQGYIKQILIVTTDGVACDLPGKALFYRHWFLSGTKPYQDTFAVAAGTYHLSIPIFFSNPMLKRPDDTVLDTSRYKSISIFVTSGSVADLFATVGDSAVTVTLDLYAIQSPIPVSKHGKPVIYPVLRQLVPTDPSSRQSIDIERASDLAIRSIFAYTGNGVTAGVPFSGTPADTTIASMGIVDNFGNVIDPTTTWAAHGMLQKVEESLESQITGYRRFKLMQDDSIFAAYPTGNKSLLQLQWVNGTLSTSQVCGWIDGFRTLKVATGRR